jgi:cellulose synthase/poly-beta-1,6-N-acetylglucosamine synthase-like glycosyltransferase
MTTILAAIAAVSLLGLFYVYAGYGLALRVAAAFARAQAVPETAPGEWPRLTVLVTVFNEERVIAERIANVLDCDYPAHRLELVVASDGSTDATDSIVQATRDPRVRLFRPGARGGKSMTQNLAVSTANGDIVVFTDADTAFDRKFLLEIARPFQSADVGAVDGHLGFRRGDDGDLGASQGAYWRYELTLRELESRLGLLAVASGACMAVRRELLRPLPADVGEDCVVPLDVVEQGRRVVHAAGALALDRLPATPAGELRARTRMTLRNWKGTWLHAWLLNPLRHPGYAWALWSHKLLRWLSPFMLLLATLACAALAAESAFFAFAAAGFGVFYGLGLVGWWAVRRGPPIPVAGTVYSFLLANAGFLFGIVSAARGRSVARYANAEKP